MGQKMGQIRAIEQYNCAQPLAKKLGVDVAVRASFYLYNTHEEVDAFLNAMEDIRKKF